MIKTQVNEILTKKMDRKDFLKHIGVGVVAAIGLTSFLKAVSQTQTDSGSATAAKPTGGYGGSAYGGNS